jgi:hypothetical protein
MTKYEPLTVYLRGQYGDEVHMTFAGIERVLGFPLPPSARKHRPWWSNNADNSAMTKAWLGAGFRTERVDLKGERLVFVRLKEKEMSSNALGFGEASSRPAGAAQAVAARHPAIGSMKGMLTIMPGVDLTQPADPEWIARLYDENATAGDLVGGLDDPVPGDR